MFFQVVAAARFEVNGTYSNRRSSWQVTDVRMLN